MKRLVQYSHGRVAYTGRMDRAAFNAWAESSGGCSVINEIASRARFALLGRRRAVRLRLWRELVEAARAEAIAGAMQHEVDAYLARFGTVAFVHNLPRADVDLHRLVVVPRVFACVEAYRRIKKILKEQVAFAALEGGDSIRELFTLTLIDNIAAAVVAARPTLKRPLPAGDDWIIVGVDELFEWHVPFDGPAYPGHYYVFELTRTPVTRSVRAAARDAIARLETSIASVSRSRRLDMMREAYSSLQEILALASHR